MYWVYIFGGKVVGPRFSSFCSTLIVIYVLSLQGKLSDQVYNYPEGLGEVLYREQFDFNAEPPWEPS